MQVDLTFKVMIVLSKKKNRQLKLIGKKEGINILTSYVLRLKNKDSSQLLLIYGIVFVCI